LTVNSVSHYAVVYDQPNGVVRLYINGRRTGIAAATLPLSVVDDRNAWLGRSVWQDPLFNGLIDEFRIYDGPLLDADMAASFAAGPDKLAEATPTVALAANRAAGNIEITWPASAAGFVLETASTIGGAWTQVTGTPATSGADHKVTIPIGSAGGFYRLRK
jgi:hypothetical protein